MTSRGGGPHYFWARVRIEISTRYILVPLAGRGRWDVFLLPVQPPLTPWRVASCPLSTDDSSDSPLGFLRLQSSEEGHGYPLTMKWAWRPWWPSPTPSSWGFAAPHYSLRRQTLCSQLSLYWWKWEWGCDCLFVISGWSRAVSHSLKVFCLARCILLGNYRV